MRKQGVPFDGGFGFINMLPPSTNATGSSNLASDVVALKDYFHAENFIQFSTHADASVLTVYKSSDLTTNSTQPIGFNYQFTTQSNTDQFSTMHVATTSGISLGTDDNAMYRFSVSQDELSSDLPNYYYTLTGSTGQSVSGLAVLSGSRYMRNPMPTAIS